MGKKFKDGEVEKRVEELGYIFIKKYRNNNQLFVIMKDNEEYLYDVNFFRFNHGKIPCKFHKYNKCTINNIILWCKYNKPNYILISTEYINIYSKLIFKDIFGYFYFVSFVGFEKCLPSKYDKSNPYTLQNIKLWCKLNEKPFELLENQEYEGSNKKLKWQCLKEGCEEIFEANWKDIHTGRGCGCCYKRQVRLSNCLATTNLELASQWHPTLNGDLTPYDVSCGCDREVWWQCNKGHEWKANIYSRNRGNGCPYCAGKLPTKENNLLVDNLELCAEWNYNLNKKLPQEYLPHGTQRVWWKCLECGFEWKTTILDRNRKDGKESNCPECNRSKGEIKISKSLNNHNFIKIYQDHYNNLNHFDILKDKYYIPQKEFDGLIGLGGGLLSYDFYLPNYNLLVEYQGMQHEKYIPGLHKSKKDFEKQVEHDRRKKEFAQNNNINLIEIWYFDYDNIESILEKELHLSEVVTI